MHTHTHTHTRYGGYECCASWLGALPGYVMCVCRERVGSSRQGASCPENLPTATKTKNKKKQGWEAVDKAHDVLKTIELLPPPDKIAGSHTP